MGSGDEGSYFVRPRKSQGPSHLHNILVLASMVKGQLRQMHSLYKDPVLPASSCVRLSLSPTLPFFFSSGHYCCNLLPHPSPPSKQQQ
jgi:hypothetical protein